MRKTILIVEDDVPLHRMLTIALQAEGFICLGADSAGQAITVALSHHPDLIILDLGLPDRDGSHVLARLRESSRVPVLVLSARDAECSKVQLLNAGANDYVSKPFGVAELIARINVLLRDVGEQPVSASCRNIGRLKIDPANQQVWLDEHTLTLTNKEFSMLDTLTQSPGQLVTQQQLLQRIWGAYHVDDSHYLRILISQLRKKLRDDPTAPQLIETVPGRGYRFIIQD